MLNFMWVQKVTRLIFGRKNPSGTVSKGCCLRIQTQTGRTWESSIFLLKHYISLVLPCCILLCRRLLPVIVRPLVWPRDVIPTVLKANIRKKIFLYVLEKSKSQILFNTHWIVGITKISHPWVLKLSLHGIKGFHSCYMAFLFSLHK